MPEIEEERIPKVFISYSHDSPEHKKWTAEFASKLVEKGVDVILDQWDLNLGDDVPKFMEKSVSDVDRVLVICTETYVRKADEGKGGVGYETMIVTGELVRNLGTTKFIPLIRQEEGSNTLPKFLSTRFYINLSEDKDLDEQFELLIRELHEEPALKKPLLGKNPFAQKPSGEELPHKPGKQIEILDFSKLGNDASSFYKEALEVARQGDLVAWRKLIQHARKPLRENILEWRKNAETFHDAEGDKYIEFVMDGISIYAPLFSIALAGIESGRDKFNNQISLMDDILFPKGWNWSGSTRIVHFPFSAAYIYQGLHGAMGLLTNQLDISIRLARTNFETPMGSEKKPLFLYPDIIGWPDALGRNSAIAWQKLNELPNRWIWLKDAFGSIDEFRSALCAYYISLNILEYSFRLSTGNRETISKKEGWPLIPPSFNESDRDICRSAYRLLISEPDQVKNIWFSYDLKDGDVKSLWNDWIDLIRTWLNPAKLGVIGFRNDVIHKDLLKDL